ncbi:MAG: glycosyl transferase, partial [Anaerolineae bacterium]|nr:hypothetical protein [Thermoflexales bacterium]MDW8408936.1 glycosyl transferase [Anaerolineae bacterium]
FLPSSRSVAFLKSAWQAVGGYPEWLDYCEDLIFDFKLRARFGLPAFASDAIAYFRPRTSLTAFIKQYYRYARGDGKANLWWKRHATRYATYLIILPALLAGMMGAPSSSWQVLCAALLGFGAGIYLRRPYRRLPAVWHTLPPLGKLMALLWVPVIRIAGDVAKMAGYPVGLWWRRQHRSVIDTE